MTWMEGGGTTGRYGACAPTAAQSPRTHREENAGQGKSAHFWRSFLLAMSSRMFLLLEFAEGPHAFCNCRRRTSEIALYQFLAQSASGPRTPANAFVSMYLEFLMNLAVAHGADPVYAMNDFRVPN